MGRRMNIRNYCRVYRAVRKSDHGWWVALRCCNDVRKGSWQARDSGEMRAQASLMADAAKKRGK